MGCPDLLVEKGQQALFEDLKGAGFFVVLVKELVAVDKIDGELLGWICEPFFQLL